MINLYQMRQLMRRTIKIRWRIEQEMARATKITSTLTGMPRGGSNHNQTEASAITLTEIKEAYHETLDTLEQMQQALDPLIDTLDNPDDRAVMRLRYIRGYSPEDIAEGIHRTDRSVYYYLSRAEDQLARRYPDQVQK